MKGYVDNIEKLTVDNDNFRKVLYTGKNSQLVLMTIQSGDEIGAEVHEEHDQFFRIDEGSGKVVIDDNEYEVSDGFAIVVPAGSNHNVINTGEGKLKLYTIYSPPEHRDGTLHATRDEAIADDEHFDGITTE
ncbi:MAG: cupin domain-containing protein [Patescibacteria group bacterium]|nr:cupin domain-containing protein [Patescibacteria group bacterium]